MKEAKKPIKLLCNPQKLPKPQLVKTDKREGQKSKRDWSKVNRGANEGKYGRPVFWTEARCAVLRQLKEEGKSYKEIGEEMGKSSEACRRQWYVINGYCLNGRK